MRTECSGKTLQFHPLGQREVRADFNGGTITSDGGALLLREVEKRTRIVERFAACFTDHRRAERIEHTVGELVGQRVYGLALGYEDLNDHEQLRRDPMLAILAEKRDPTGESRVRERDEGKALAGKSTLNRIELTKADASKKERYKKVVIREEAVDRLMVDVFLESFEEAPTEVVLDLDATDDPVYGKQEGRFFHGYYGHYCYLPLYMFCGDALLCARLRASNQDASAGCVEELERIVKQIREVWPQVKIIIRGDSGFCRDELMKWCEDERVDFVIGLAKNERLKKAIEKELEEVASEYEQTGKAARVFKDFEYQTRESWSRARRVVGKAEHLEKGSNPRFVVTSLPAEVWEARRLYEELYCARGEMENRIKEQLMLFADRTSTAFLRSNQVRLYFSSIAYLLMEALRRLGLAGTEWAQAQATTIRLKVLKIGALIRVTVRKIWIALAEGYPYAQLWGNIFARLEQVPMRG